MRRRRITRKVLAVAVVVGALAAGGAAFTNSNTLPATVAGYGTTSVSGANASDIAYTLNSTGDTITAETITWDSDVSADNVEAAFNGGSLTACTTTGGSGTSTSTCNISQSTSGATTFAVTVTNP